MKVSTQKGQEMPTVYRHVLSCDWFRTFTFKERIKILLGCSLLVVIKVACQHNPGRIQPIIAGELSNATTPSEHLKAQMDASLVEQKEES